MEQGGENYVNVVLTYEILKMNLRKEGKLDERTSSLKESRMKPETRFCVMHSIILNILDSKNLMLIINIMIVVTHSFGYPIFLLLSSIKK